MDIGQKLKELRLAAGLSQLDLAKLLGVTRNAVSQWESGETQPTTKRLAMLSRALNVPIDDIMVPTDKVRQKIFEHALRLFNGVGYDDTSIETICASAEVSRFQFDSLFTSKDALLLEVARELNNKCLEALRRAPPSYGNIVTRLKYLLRHLYSNDIQHIRISGAVLSYSWRWTDALEREDARNRLEFHQVIIDLFDEAAAQGQIATGNFRAASNLILAAYNLGLRKALFERQSPDQLIRLMEPQLAIILAGFSFQPVPGFSEPDATKE